MQYTCSLNSRLATKLKEAEDKKEKIEDDIKTKQDHLENLQPKLTTILQVNKPLIYEPRREKTCLRSFRQSEFQTSLFSYRD